jgi:hypothetical protein
MHGTIPSLPQDVYMAWCSVGQLYLHRPPGMLLDRRKRLIIRMTSTQGTFCYGLYRIPEIKVKITVSWTIAEVQSQGSLLLVIVSSVCHTHISLPMMCAIGLTSQQSFCSDLALGWTQ